MSDFFQFEQFGRILIPLAVMAGRHAETVMHDRRHFGTSNLLIVVLLLVTLGIFAARQIPLTFLQKSTEVPARTAPSTKKAQSTLLLSDAQPLSRDRTVPPDPPKTQGITGIFLQIGAYTNAEKADKKKKQLQEKDIGRVYLIKQQNARSRVVYKVLLGTFESKYAADEFKYLNGTGGFPVVLTEENNEWLH